MLPLTTLSIVLITKNQAWNVRRLISSVLSLRERMPDTEIVLVDSASSDETVQTACEYPIQVVRLHDHDLLTPAAGRYIGYQYSTGQYVLFLDGDMEFLASWLEPALQLFQTHAQAAVITGQVLDVCPDTPPEQMPVIEDVAGTREMKYSGGAALFRRDVLERVGQFNPYLCSDEEPDLCIRIRHAGYRVLKTNRAIVFHYTVPRRALSTMLARWKRNLYLGFGQNMRYHFGRPTFATYMRERGYALTPGLAIAAGAAACGWWIVTGHPALFGGFLLLGLLFVLAASIRKRSLTAVVEILLHRLLIFAGTIKGLARKAPAPDTYPVQHERLHVGQPAAADSS